MSATECTVHSMTEKKKEKEETCFLSKDVRA